MKKIMSTLFFKVKGENSFQTLSALIGENLGRRIFWADEYFGPTKIWTDVWTDKV